MSETTPSDEPAEMAIICRNCGSLDVQQWCPVCGQENVPSAVPVREVLMSFLDEFLKFDTKIWITLKALMTRPGLLTHEYLIGHRVRYVAPIKLFLALSFVTFFVVALIPQAKKQEGDNSKSFNKGMFLAQSLIPGIGAASQTTDSTPEASAAEAQAELLKNLMLRTKQKNGESHEDHQKRVDEAKKHADACADVATDIVRTEASLREQVRLNTQREARRDAWISGNQTTLSLLSVPMYALLLACLLRKDTKRLYVEHLIFALHYQCFGQLASMTEAIVRPMPMVGWLANLVVMIAPPIYFVLAARTVYNLPVKRLVLILIGFLLLGFIVVSIKEFTAGIIYQLFG